jgi:uncharacterized LabA/DUF88 family protein
VRTSVYIDGFNLYFGSLRHTPHKWVDVKAMAERHLASHHQITAIKYFTAKINARPGDPDQPVRQETYLRALRTLPNLRIIFGHYLTKVVRMPLAHPLPGGPATVEVMKTEEKGSDVNLATHLVHDAHLGLFDCAVIVSGDSDLLSPVRMVITDLKKAVGVLNPQRHPCVVLKRHATFYKHLRANFIAASQFPTVLTDVRGPFSKPQSW